jgi:plasmid stabilization system protein ParE
MAEVIWTEPALADLEAIADYIAVANPTAAGEFVRRVFAHIDKLEQHPQLGPAPPELEESRYRQIVEPPCRVFYRPEGRRVFILHVMRSERLLTQASLERAEHDES